MLCDYENFEYQDNQDEIESYNEDKYFSQDKTLLTLGEIMPYVEKSTVTGKRNRSRSRAELKTFDLFKDKNNRQPKKEYVRCGIVRAFKRGMREALEGKTPKSKLHQVIKQNPKSVAAWEVFKQECIDNRHTVFEISKTEEGPNTDGKSKRTKSSESNSYNDTFCKNFFESPLVLNLYQLYCKVVFSVKTCKDLRSKFAIIPKKHDDKNCTNCERPWTLFRRYVTLSMLEDIGVQVMDCEPLE
ncbi:hypothetical protein SteCoe_933 [Stentor coeruleus]|uniref:Uncharacterized protein n=1 Tax=Stentor coeruleus TaxID=5963 RepID=A0A1R2D356_9CILI|nr:hypothetical protein SteCoe_933 [Stentor coeruleus]